jgi:hypothetical protein
MLRERMRTQRALGARDGIELAKLLDGAAPWPDALREHVSPLAKMIAERSAAERHAATVQRPGAHRADRRPRVTVERVKREAAEAGCWWREGARPNGDPACPWPRLGRLTHDPSATPGWRIFKSGGYA